MLYYLTYTKLYRPKILDKISKQWHIVRHLTYNPVIGFSWDSITPKGDSTDITVIGQQQGPKLAHFILDFKNKCSDSQVRMIGHSMGGRVTLSTLASLFKNKEWKSENFKLASVDLLGAGVASSWGVDGIESPMRKIIEQVVINFYNLVDPKDKVISGTYPRVEHHTALNTGAHKGISLPSNYIQQDVQNEIRRCLTHLTNVASG